MRFAGQGVVGTGESLMVERRMDGRTRFAGQGVLVTGGASGIGLAAVRRFAAEGARVVVADLDGEAARAAAEPLGGRGVACDVGDPAQLDALVAGAGPLDVVFGNAGLLRTAPLESLTLAEFEAHLRVNLTANLLLAQRAAPVLRARGGGAIVFTASLGGLRGTAGSAAYNASKGGLVNLTRSLADELAPHGIRVNCLCPGWIDTAFNDPFWSHAGAGERERIAASIPLGRQGTPDDVAPAALFLASAEAGYITGQTLVIDGGVQAT
jgi:3-oxoacyl-[acyl-carrier protein] reductase